MYICIYVSSISPWLLSSVLNGRPGAGATGRSPRRPSKPTGAARCEAPRSSHEGPLSSFEDPLSSFEAPLSSHEGPLSPFEAPLSSFEAPLSFFEAPLSSFVAPLSSFEAPLSCFEAPLSSFKALVSLKPRDEWSQSHVQAWLHSLQGYFAHKKQRPPSTMQ